MNEVKSIGEVIRGMVEMAMKSESKSFSVSVKNFAVLVTGIDRGEIIAITDNEALAMMPRLKSSYIYNTVSRMTCLSDAGLLAKYKFEDDEDGQRIFTIYLVPGKIQKNSRSVADKIKREKVIEDFKSRVMKVMPDISHLDGEEVILAAKVIKAMKDIIEEMK